jgi:hypothetical protein
MDWCAPTATLYVSSASAATVTVTPMMQQNMKTRAHQAKFGNSPLTSLMMELMKAMSHASCPNLGQYCTFSPCWRVAIVWFARVSYNCNGYGGEGKWITDDVCEIEARSSLIVTIHFGLKHQRADGELSECWWTRRSMAGCRW